MRAALLDDATVLSIARPVLILLFFAVILLPVSLATFNWELLRTKVTGTLTHR